MLSRINIVYEVPKACTVFSGQAWLLRLADKRLHGANVTPLGESNGTGVKRYHTSVCVSMFKINWLFCVRELIESEDPADFDAQSFKSRYERSGELKEMLH